MSSARQFFRIGFAPEGQTGTAIELEDYDLGTLDYQDLSKGRLDSLPGEVRLFASLPRNPAAGFDVLVNCLNWIIVSTRLSKAFTSIAGDQVECLPVKIEDKTTNISAGNYVVVNPFILIDVLSEEKSRRTKLKLGSKFPILKPVIKGKLVPPQCHIFRIESEPFRIIVDDLLKSSILQVPHDGLAFIPIDQE